MGPEKRVCFLSKPNLPKILLKVNHLSHLQNWSFARASAYKAEKVKTYADNCGMPALAVTSLLFALILVFCPPIQAQGPSIINMAEAGAYSLVERSDWSRFDNGSYIGLVYRELRASMVPVTENRGSFGGSTLYQGNFFVIQNTIRNMRHEAQALETVIPVSFELKPDGEMIIENDRGFPILRGFPAAPNRPLRPGEKWQAPGSRAADPLNTGHALIIPFLAEYEYRGLEIYRDTPVHRLHAVYASRYQRFEDADEPNGTGNGSYIVRVQGSHMVDILIRVEDGLPVLMRDNLDISYTFEDGSTRRYRGFTLTFGQGIQALDREQLIASLEGNLPATELSEIPEGVRLLLRDIRFVPDSAEFLPEERYRLDLIAEALKQIPDRNFLVEGHTADLGRPAGEMELSIERAKRMVDELVRRGISPTRFIYKGWGGTRPIAGNSSEAGRNANRRVEITILE
jgi:outer membrane protein OmpA-like peptidoglycan-associated protein